jgi:hypothetical protein
MIGLVNVAFYFQRKYFTNPQPMTAESVCVDAVRR